MPSCATVDQVSHTCEPVASKMLEKFPGELAKKRENFVGLRYVKKVGKLELNLLGNPTGRSA